MPEPVTDLSERAVRIARMLDRLESGKFLLMIEKPQNGDWHVVIALVERDVDAAPDGLTRHS